MNKLSLLFFGIFCASSIVAMDDVMRTKELWWSKLKSMSLYEAEIMIGYWVRPLMLKALSDGNRSDAQQLGETANTILYLIEAAQKNKIRTPREFVQKIKILPAPAYNYVEGEQRIRRKSMERRRLIRSMSE